VWWHSGSIPGYEAIIAYAPASRASVALLVNDDSGSLSNLWLTLLRTAAAATTPPVR
jgi:hypothetical protein